ncbi:DUF6980 family protein [Streptomyces ehimensis]|uniref:DUF6980 family protein n=1 Tax=Streptomyces ehimensis TaxID=68195 RepID=A0ABV9BT55_9ACTN
MTNHCCEAMDSHVNVRCREHNDIYACPDALIGFSAKFREYGLIVHDGGTSSIIIEFCPWCGRRLPDSQRDTWHAELRRRGIDAWEDEVPAEFQDARWLDSLPRTHGTDGTPGSS